MNGEPILSGVVRSDGMIQTSTEQAQVDAENHAAAEAAKYAGTIGLALSTVDQQLQTVNHQRDIATDEEQKLKLSKEAARLARMMTVLEFETGLTEKMNEERQKLGFSTMSAEQASQYTQVVKDQVWRSLNLRDAINRVDEAWKKSQETHKDDPEFLAERKSAYTDARILLMRLEQNEHTIR